jgi:hypothetical protein
MSGVDHYKEAERLLKGGRTGETAPEAATRIAEAQAHATLAMAAATALARYADADGRRAWNTAPTEPAPPSRYEIQQQWEEGRRRAEEEQHRWEEMRDGPPPNAAKPR